MASKNFRDQLSLTLIGLIIFLFVFGLHTYAAFYYTAPSTLYNFVAFFLVFEILGTVALLAFLQDLNDRSTPSILVGVVALLPCVIVWVVGAGLTPWTLTSWAFLVAFWAGYATELCLGPLSRTIDALHALKTRLRDRRHQPPQVRSARGLSRSSSPRRSYAFTELSSSLTLNGSPRDVPGTPVQSTVKDTGDIV